MTNLKQFEGRVDLMLYIWPMANLKVALIAILSIIYYSWFSNYYIYSFSIFFTNRQDYINII